jgi:hypothetical protein
MGVTGKRSDGKGHSPFICLSGRRDSNPRPLGPKLRDRCNLTEPPMPRLSVSSCHAIQLRRARSFCNHACHVPEREIFAFS